MKYVISIILLFSLHRTNAQRWVGVGIGANQSQLQYTNSLGIKDENLRGLPGVNASFFFLQRVSKKKAKRFPPKTILSTEFGYKSIKIKDTKSSLLSTWSLQYLTGNIILRKHINSKHAVNAFYGGGLALDYLLSGSQTEGFEQFDLTEDLKRSNTSLTAEFGITYFQSHDSFSELKFSYLRGLSNLEKSNDQKALLSAFKISGSVFFELTNKR